MPIRGIVYGNTEPIRSLQSLDKQLSFGQQKGLMGREGNNTNIRRAGGLGQYTIQMQVNTIWEIENLLTKCQIFNNNAFNNRLHYFHLLLL